MEVIKVPLNQRNVAWATQSAVSGLEVGRKFTMTELPTHGSTSQVWRTLNKMVCLVSTGKNRSKDFSGSRNAIVWEKIHDPRTYVPDKIKTEGDKPPLYPEECSDCNFPRHGQTGCIIYFDFSRQVSKKLPNGLLRR